MKKKLLIVLLMAPEILVLGFFGYAYGISPPESGREFAEKLELPYKTVVAHRGLSHWAPEETAPAYLAAREIGAHYLEMDVQRTRDGVLVCFHDDTLTRTSNVKSVFPGREAEGIEKFTLEELRGLDAGTWFNEKNPDRARTSFRGLKILTLEEAIDIAEGGVNKPGLYIETKSPSRFPGVEKELVEILRKRGWLGPTVKTGAKTGTVGVAYTRARVILQSFDHESLKRLRELDPAVPLVYLVNDAMEKSVGWDGLVRSAREVGVGMGPVGYLAWPWYTRKAHAAGLVVHPYTINKTWQMWMVSQFGADGLFTDRAATALEYFGHAQSIDVPAVLEKIGYAK